MLLKTGVKIDSSFATMENLKGFYPIDSDTLYCWQCLMLKIHGREGEAKKFQEGANLFPLQNKCIIMIILFAESQERSKMR